MKREENKMSLQEGNHAIQYENKQCHLCLKKVANCRVYYHPVFLKLAQGVCLSFLEQQALVELSSIVNVCYNCIELDDWRVRGFVEASYLVSKSE